ncbi:MAG: zeta toxin family protein [Verrucomicrobiota bacterium]
MIPPPDKPAMIAIAGPNGAGKTTFYETNFADCGLPWINADQIARRLQIDAYQAARQAEAVRQNLVTAGESFIFETVFSDPVGAKVDFLSRAVEAGYHVQLHYIGIDGPERSQLGVNMRTMQGGHDVPAEKLAPRYRRSLENLRRAVAALPSVVIYDNSDLARPYVKLAEGNGGKIHWHVARPPRWIKNALADN